MPDIGGKEQSFIDRIPTATFFIGLVAIFLVLVLTVSIGDAIFGNGGTQNEADINNSEEMEIVLDERFEGIESVEVYAHSATITVADDRVDAIAICQYTVDAANGYTFDLPHWQGVEGGILSDEVTLREATVTTGGWFAEETECQFSES